MRSNRRKGMPGLLEEASGRGAGDVSYQRDLEDPRWQRKRLEIFQRDCWECMRCGRSDVTLTVHHRRYSGKPWETYERDLETLCLPCHEKEHVGQPTLFALRQMIERAHAAALWDEVWRLCHLVSNDKD